MASKSNSKAEASVKKTLIEEFPSILRSTLMDACRGSIKFTQHVKFDCSIAVSVDSEEFLNLSLNDLIVHGQADNGQRDLCLLTQDVDKSKGKKKKNKTVDEMDDDVIEAVIVERGDVDFDYSQPPEELEEPADEEIDRIQKIFQEIVDKNTISCPVCFTTFAQNKNVRRHFKSVHAQGMNFVVTKNGQVDYRGFEEKKQVIKVEYGCPTCDRSFTSTKALRRHLREEPDHNDGDDMDYDSGDEFSDDAAGGDLTTLERAQRDFSRLTMNESLTCPMCKQVFTTHRNCKRHYITVHAKNIRVDLLEGAGSFKKRKSKSGNDAIDILTPRLAKRLYRSIVKEYDKNANRTCPVCQHQYSRHDDLKRHFRNVECRGIVSQEVLIRYAALDTEEETDPSDDQNVVPIIINNSEMNNAADLFNPMYLDASTSATDAASLIPIQVREMSDSMLLGGEDMDYAEDGSGDGSHTIVKSILNDIIDEIVGVEKESDDIDVNNIGCQGDGSGDAKPMEIYEKDNDEQSNEVIDVGVSISDGNMKKGDDLMEKEDDSMTVDKIEEEKLRADEEATDGDDENDDHLNGDEADVENDVEDESIKTPKKTNDEETSKTPEGLSKDEVMEAFELVKRERNVNATCPLCKFKFSRKAHLKRHFRNIHAKYVMNVKEFDEVTGTPTKVVDTLDRVIASIKQSEMRITVNERKPPALNITDSRPQRKAAKANPFVSSREEAKKLPSKRKRSSRDSESEESEDEEEEENPAPKKLKKDQKSKQDEKKKKKEEEDEEVEEEKEVDELFIDPNQPVLINLPSLTEGKTKLPVGIAGFPAQTKFKVVTPKPKPIFSKKDIEEMPKVVIKKKSLSTPKSNKRQVVKDRFHFKKQNKPYVISGSTFNVTTVTGKKLGGSDKSPAKQGDNEVDDVLKTLDRIMETEDEVHREKLSPKKSPSKQKEEFKTGRTFVIGGKTFHAKSLSEEAKKILDDREKIIKSVGRSSVSSDTSSSLLRKQIFPVKTSFAEEPKPAKWIPTIISQESITLYKCKHCEKSFLSDDKRNSHQITCSANLFRKKVIVASPQTIAKPFVRVLQGKPNLSQPMLIQGGKLLPQSIGGERIVTQEMLLKDGKLISELPVSEAAMSQHMILQDGMIIEGNQFLQPVDESDNTQIISIKSEAEVLMQDDQGHLSVNHSVQDESLMQDDHYQEGQEQHMMQEGQDQDHQGEFEDNPHQQILLQPGQHLSDITDEQDALQAMVNLQNAQQATLGQPVVIQDGSIVQESDLPQQQMVTLIPNLPTSEGQEFGQDVRFVIPSSSAGGAEGMTQQIVIDASQYQEVLGQIPVGQVIEIPAELATSQESIQNILLHYASQLSRQQEPQ